MDYLSKAIETKDIGLLRVTSEKFTFNFHQMKWLVPLVIEKRWMDGFIFLIDKGCDPNLLYEKKIRPLEMWFQAHMSYCSCRGCPGRLQANKELVTMVKTGCNPFLIHPQVASDEMKACFLKSVADKCRTSVLFVLGCRGWLTKDTRGIIARMLWKSRTDWETWGF